MKLESVELSASNIAAVDAILIATDHTQYDSDFIVKHAQLVVDSRNATSGVSDPDNKIFKA